MLGLNDGVVCQFFYPVGFVQFLQECDCLLYFMDCFPLHNKFNYITFLSRILGVTTLDIVRANTFVAEAKVKRKTNIVCGILCFLLLLFFILT